MLAMSSMSSCQYLRLIRVSTARAALMSSWKAMTCVLIYHMSARAPTFPGLLAMLPDSASV